MDDSVEVTSSQFSDWTDFQIFTVKFFTFKSMYIHVSASYSQFGLFSHSVFLKYKPSGWY